MKLKDIIEIVLPSLFLMLIIATIMWFYGLKMATFFILTITTSRIFNKA